MPILRRIIISLFIALVLAFAGYFLLREYFLAAALEKVSNKFQERYRYTFAVEKASFTGFARVTLNDISLVHESGDTLFACAQATASFSLARFLKGQPPVNNAELSDGHITLTEQDSLRNNYRALLSPADRNKNKQEVTERRNGPGSIFKFAWKKFLAIADFNFTITNLEIRWKAPDYFERLQIEDFSLHDTKLRLHAKDSIEGNAVIWLSEGTINRHNGVIELAGGSRDSSAHELPFIKKITGIKSGLSHVYVRLEKSDESENSYIIKGNVTAPFINHWRIAPDDVRIDSASAEMILTAADSSLMIGTGSAVKVNRITMNLTAEVTVAASEVVSLHVEIPPTQADAFFNSLPQGLFSSLKGIQAKGTLSYNLDLDLNTANPDTVKFNSDLNSKNFRISRFGAEDLTLMSRPFMYEARENDRLVKVIETGTANPSFTPFASIPPLLVSCILTAEDGTFYHHRGFNEEAFRKSIATNIKQKRFARGGSTISMQLVKNVHLNRNKTISRKVEEALLVWIIENQGLCSKERILEVYLNIIEWGPGIYGIHEAAHYYFDKEPSALTLEECIYLSSIIPNPKAFRYSFDKEGMLRERLAGYFKLVAGRLRGKEIITQEQLDSLTFNVTLAGPARELVVPQDSIPADSTAIFEETVLPELP
jgi:hypothetical protein